MNKFGFESDNSTSKKVEKIIDKVSFSYHINTFDFPEIHGHRDYWEFTLLTDGKLTNTLNGEKNRVTAGQLFFSTTDDIHSLKKSGNEKLRYVNIIAREKAILQIASLFSPDFVSILKGMKRTYDFPAELIKQINDIVHQVLLLDDESGEKFNGLLCGAVMLILQYLYGKSVDYIDFDKQTAWVNELNKSMKTPEFLNYNVADLCDLLHYSRMQLTRIFRNKFNTTPHRFLVDYKLRYAQNLLITTDMKVIDIAEFVGFTNLSSFNSYFQNAYGVSPGRFRKNR